MEIDLLDKINDLFEYRGFPELYQLSGWKPQEIRSLNDALVDLQSKIYYLDAYLEENWELKEDALQHYWKDIHRSLLSLGLDNNKLMDYTNHILKYQKHESELRQGLLPTRLNMEYFYFYKSCDVKLIRRILMEKLPGVVKLFDQADWRYFDLVTEVNDDVTDLAEDLHTINGNRFLISLQEVGQRKTEKIFTEFLKEITNKSSHRFKGVNSAFKQRIHETTLEQVDITRKLLKQQIEKYGDTSESRLSQLLNNKKRA